MCFTQVPPYSLLKLHFSPKVEAFMKILSRLSGVLDWTLKMKSY